jgi:nucleoside phosphorylase
MPTPPRADVLLVTCNENELNAVSAAFASQAEVPLATAPQVTALDYGLIHGNRVLHVHTRQGEDCAVRVQRAVEGFHPVAVLAVGICWGAHDEPANPDKRQRMGDVLIARQIKATGARRVSDEGVKHPGEQANSSGAMLEALLTVMPEWRQLAEGNRADDGLVVSEPTLFNSRAARDELAKAHGALGGEMEGQGILRWAAELKVDWLLVKAICDWGYNKQNPNKEADQRLAATQAAGLVRHFLGRVDMAGMLRPDGGQGGTGSGHQIIHGGVQTAINAPGSTFHISNTRGQ